MSAEALLDYAGNYLAEDPSHWMQGAISDFNGAVCAYGAIDLAREYVAHTASDMLAAERALMTIITKNYPGAATYVSGDDAGLASIPAWNDDGDRQHGEVVEMMQKARAYAGEQGI